MFILSDYPGNCQKIHRIYDIMTEFCQISGDLILNTEYVILWDLEKIYMTISG